MTTNSSDWDLGKCPNYLYLPYSSCFDEIRTLEIGNTRPTVNTASALQPKFAKSPHQFK